MADKKMIVAALENQMKALESEIGKLKDLAGKVDAGSVRIGSEVETLENEKEILKMEFQELKQSEGEAWKDLELGLQKKVEDLTINLNTAVNKLKEKM